MNGRLIRAVAMMVLVAVTGVGGWAASRGIGVLGAADSAVSKYTAVTPSRILDTRSAGARRPDAGTIVIVHTGLPGSTAVGINIALTETGGPGFVTAWASNAGQPLTSIINSTKAGENISNFVVVPVAPDGTFKLFTNAPTHMVVDLMGYFIGTVPPLGGGPSPVTSVASGGPTVPPATIPPVTAPPTSAGGTTTTIPAPPPNARFNFPQGGWRISYGTGKYGADDHYIDVGCKICWPAPVIFEFTGTQVTLYGARAPHHGAGTVQIDGGDAQPFAQNGATRQDNVEFWRSGVLPYGRHQITVIGQVHPQTGGGVISIDRAVIDGWMSVNDSVIGEVGPPPTNPPPANPPLTTAPPPTSPPTTNPPSGNVYPGAFCSTVGATGTFNGNPYVCSTTSRDGTLYQPPGTARWRQV